MGGFYFLEAQSDPRPLSPEQVEDQVEISSFDLPTKSDIDDKSKGDVFSKVIASLQALWFVMQSLARPVQQLPLTKLEIATLAYTSINVAMYAFWWSKPLSVGRPVRVWSSHAPPIPRLAPSPYLQPGSQLPPSPQLHRAESFETFRTAKTSPTMEDSDAYSLHTFATSQTTLVFAPSITGAVSVYSLFKASSREEGSFMGKLAGLFKTVMGAQDDEVDLSKLPQVPTFYAGVPTDPEIITADVIALVFAMIFGAVHCGAWSLAFPSHIEQLLWRTASMVLVGVPGIYLLLMGLYAFGEQLLVKYMLLISLVGIPLYILARITLLVLMFTTLRSLPPTALETVHWTTFIPHI